jgi:hypothetical protein
VHVLDVSVVPFCTLWLGSDGCGMASGVNGAPDGCAMGPAPAPVQSCEARV